uniref:Uncharacterized protein n=1 Tax=viral metagenome TaxID=1070528 RepID=A0A6C0ELN6_9ZZZZ
MDNFNENIKNIENIDNLQYMVDNNDKIGYGLVLGSIVENINKTLPRFIIFKPKIIKYYKKSSCSRKKKTYQDKKWKYITNLVSCDPKDCSYCLKFYVNKNDFLSKYDAILDKTASIKPFIKKNIQVIFHDGEIQDYIIYKKLQVKFDFFYIPLEIYNYVKANIDLKKTIQVLELLGPKQIDIAIKKIDGSESERGLGGSTDIGGFQLINNVSRSDSEKIDHSTEYTLKMGFFFEIDDLIEHISAVKHIFMSKDDYNKDFELRYLIRSRIESYLKSYSRLVYVKHLSAVENKLQSSLKNVYIKLDLEYKSCFKTYGESIIKIICEFYDVEELASVKNVPLNEHGFIIIKNKFLNSGNNDSNILKNNIKILIDKIMTKYNIKYIHDMIINNDADVSEMINIQSEDIDKYNKTYNSVETYNDIQMLVDYIMTDVNFVPLNNKGFLVIKSKGEEEYLYEIRIFFKRVLEKFNIGTAYNCLNDFFKAPHYDQNNKTKYPEERSSMPKLNVPFPPKNINEAQSSRRSTVINFNTSPRFDPTRFDATRSMDDVEDMDNYNLLERQNTLFKTFDTYEDIIKYIEQFLNDPYNTSVNMVGFEKLKRYGRFDINNKHAVKNIRIFLTRFIERHTIDIKYLDIYNKLPKEQQLLIFTKYSSLKSIQKDPNYYKYLNNIISKLEQDVYFAESKAIDKKYKRDINKNKKLIQKHIIKPCEFKNIILKKTEPKINNDPHLGVVIEDRVNIILEPKNYLNTDSKHNIAFLTNL